MYLNINCVHTVYSGDRAEQQSITAKPFALDTSYICPLYIQLHCDFWLFWMHVRYVKCEFAALLVTHYKEGVLSEYSLSAVMASCCKLAKVSCLKQDNSWSPSNFRSYFIQKYSSYILWFDSLLIYSSVTPILLLSCSQSLYVSALVPSLFLTLRFSSHLWISV